MSNHLKLCLFLAISLVVASANADWYQDEAGIMGTNIRVELWADSEHRGQAALKSVMDEMHRINALMSPYIENSELSKLNKEAKNGAVAVSKELFDLIALSISVSEQSKGAFDITFASVGYLYNYRDQQRPDEKQILDLLDAINYRHLELNQADSSIRFAHPNVRIDLGGIAKGHAVDNAVEILRAQGIKHALVTAGGDTKLLGDRQGRPWIVGIRDPRNRDKQAVVLPLSETALSTSGDYERFFEEDGRRYHHILSPKSGKSVYEVQSVSILGPSSTLNDAYSTAVFVLGLNKGIEFIDQIPDYDVIIMDNQRKMHYSRGLESGG